MHRTNFQYGVSKMKLFGVQDLPAITPQGRRIVWAVVDRYVQSNLAPHLQDGSLDEFAICSHRVKQMPVAFASVQELCESLFFIQRVVKNNGVSDTPVEEIDFAIEMLTELRRRLRVLTKNSNSHNGSEQDKFMSLMHEAIRMKSKNVTE